MNSVLTNKSIKKLEEAEEALTFEINHNDVPPDDVVAFNELRSCSDLLRLYETKQLEIQPDFQRDIVWSNTAQTRFIDSLAKQIPIPSLCISLDYKTDKRIVIDGLQRIHSIIEFLSNDDWELAKLSDIDHRLSGKKVYTVRTDSKDIYDRVQNLMIPITVIRCDYSEKSHNEYLFTIFNRLNSGGMKLNNQEIRNCIFNGSFNSSLKKLAKLPETKKVLGKKDRFMNEEMILRFFAFNDQLDIYDGQLSTFLNQYMFKKKELNSLVLSEKENLYLSTLKIIHERIFDKKQSSLGKTWSEGLLYGVAQNIENLEVAKNEHIKLLYENFRSLPEFSIDNLKAGLSAKDKVIERLKASKNCFSK